ncbi:MAG: VTT domain-containing protein [Bacteroidota bacterium]|nr:VTT domain-containing protein [Bacteroidota bacterium]
MHELININLKDLFNPVFYINHGGIWIVLFIIFAETGLMIGFFLPGDSLLFVSGIYSKMLVISLTHMGLGNDFLEVILLFVVITISGILGNELGYWFGRKTGPILFKRKDTWLFKKRHLLQAKDFYDKHGVMAIILARFLPMLRTFAPVVAGIVKMDKKKFFVYNIAGSAAWVFVVLMAGHYLEKLFISNFGFDLKLHLFVIVIFIVLITTVPVLYKIISRRKANK